MSGWKPVVTDVVHKSGVGCVSRISLGVSEFPQLEGFPEWRQLDGGFNDGSSTSTWDHWLYLSQVTTTNEDPATA